MSILINIIKVIQGNKTKKLNIIIKYIRNIEILRDKKEDAKYIVK